MQTMRIYIVSRKSEPLKVFATTSVNLLQIKIYFHTQTATSISNDILKFLSGK